MSRKKAMHRPPLHRRRTASIGLLLLNILTVTMLLIVSLLHPRPAGSKTAADLDSAARIKLAHNDYDGAIADLTTAIKLDPHSATLYVRRAMAKYLKGDKTAALADYDEAVRLDPKASTGIRGLLKETMGDLTGALGDLTTGIELDPKNSLCFFARGSIQDKLGQHPAAIADYMRAIALNPSHARALNNLAWDYATAPGLDAADRGKAVALATKACKLTDWKDPGHLDTLAAAYAAVGQYDDAIKWQRACLDLLPSANRDVPDAKARLELYQKHQPYVIPPSKS